MDRIKASVYYIVLYSCHDTTWILHTTLRSSRTQNKINKLRSTGLIYLSKWVILRTIDIHNFKSIVGYDANLTCKLTLTQEHSD
jgi:hypothetical protein